MNYVGLREQPLSNSHFLGKMTKKWTFSSNPSQNMDLSMDDCYYFSSVDHNKQ